MRGARLLRLHALVEPIVARRRELSAGCATVGLATLRTRPAAAENPGEDSRRFPCGPRNRHDNVDTRAVNIISRYALCSASPLPPSSVLLLLFDMCRIEPLRCSNVACNRRPAEFPRSELRLSSLPAAASRRLLGDSFLSSGLPANGQISALINRHSRRFSRHHAHL